jgi:hypothetical protein
MNTGRKKRIVIINSTDKKDITYMIMYMK